MKTKILFLSIVFALVLSSCKGAKIKPLLPNEVLSETQIEEAINNECDFVLDRGAIVSMGGDVYRTVYVSEPLGEYDSVSVILHQPQEDSNTVKSLYQEKYNSRTKKEKINGLGENAYIAFPTIHIYHRGYLIEITAGSGNSQEQYDLLKLLGKKAVENLDAYYAQHEKE